MDRKRVSQSRLTHALIEKCEIGGMEVLLPSPANVALNINQG